METSAESPREPAGARPLLALFDGWWWLLAVAVAPVVVYLNQDALGMQGIYPDYVCLRHAILAGLDPAADHCPSTTFPMWGYGWLLAVTTSRWVLLLGQCLLAVAAAWSFLLVLERLDVLRGRPLRFAKAVLVVSLPWYVSHALRWPYSEASSLLLGSIALLALAVRRPGVPYRLVALSGLLFGLALNFRSDYVALPVLLVAVVVVLGRERVELLKRMAGWVAVAAVTLAPWMAYSARATGRPLVTSTNGGHVLYISLGQLAGNPWGITPFDGDPRMHRELDAHFGRHVSSLTYASDGYLRSRFVHLVLAHPAAWLRKDARNALHTLTDGFHVSCAPA